MNTYDDLSADTRTLAQAIHDMRGALGFDLDGDTNPAATIAGMGVQGYARMAVADAEQQRRDEDEASEEYQRLERITRALYDAVSVLAEDLELRQLLFDLGEPELLQQADEARAAYVAAYPAGLLPGTQPSDVL